MTFIDAAVAVLKKAKEPLTTRAFTERATEQELLATSGKTPAASMSAALNQEAALPTSGVRKVSSPGLRPAKRGSVRWTLAER